MSLREMSMSEYKLSENNWTRVAVLQVEIVVIIGRTLIDLSVWIEVLSGSWKKICLLL